MQTGGDIPVCFKKSLYRPFLVSFLDSAYTYVHRKILSMMLLLNNSSKRSSAVQLPAGTCGPASRKGQKLSESLYFASGICMDVAFLG